MLLKKLRASNLLYSTELDFSDAGKCMVKDYDF